MRFINDIKKYKKYTLYAVQTQLKSEVKNAYFDWLWWILEPLGLMIIYAVIFGAVLGATEKYFALFIFLGNTMWTFFSKCIICSVNLIRANETTINKVYIPKYILVLIEMLVNAYKMLVSFGIVVIMLFLYRVRITWRIILMIPILITFFILVYGCCLFVMHIGVFVTDLTYAINILLNMLLYLSGIFYSFDRFQEPYNKILEYGNPIAFSISAMRAVGLYGREPNYMVLFSWFLVAIALAVTGTKLIYKNENNYVKVI